MKIELLVSVLIGYCSLISCDEEVAQLEGMFCGIETTRSNDELILNELIKWRKLKVSEIDFSQLFTAVTNPCAISDALISMTIE